MLSAATRVIAPFWLTSTASKPAPRASARTGRPQLRPGTEHRQRLLSS